MNKYLIRSSVFLFCFVASFAWVVLRSLDRGLDSKTFAVLVIANCVVVPVLIYLFIDYVYELFR